MNKKNICTILVLSCDKYSDLWEPFFYCFHKFWPDCPYPVYLGSNTILFKDKNIKTLFSGPDKDWSTSLHLILQQISTPYVYLWLDDIFPINTIRSVDFSETLDFMKRSKAKHVHIEPKPKPDKVIENGKFGVYERGAPYRSVTFGFWEVTALKELLLAGESPWNFEIMGSYRTSYSDGYYCTMENIIPRIHVVEKGKIFREAYDYCINHAIPLDMSKRALLDSGFFIKSQLQKLYFNAAINVPWKFRIRIMDILRRLVISY